MSHIARYPTDRTPQSPSKYRPSSMTPVGYNTQTKLPNRNGYSPSITTYPGSSTSRISHTSSSRPISNTHPSHHHSSTMHSTALSQQTRIPSHLVSNSSHKLLRGVVIATPQNESTYGWIYCKSTNSTYQIPWSATTHYKVDQIVLFRPKNSLRGLKVEEARSLMTQNKLNIKHYSNYFVADLLSEDISHTKLLGLEDINSHYLNEDSESIHSQNMFILNTVIDVREGTEIEFKCIDAVTPGSTFSDLSASSPSKVFPMHKMVNVMERYLNGFINMNGGTIYFGITAEGRIIGQDLFGENARKLVDEIEVKICEKLREWKPSKYVQKLVKSVEIQMIDIVQIDEEEKVGFVIPNKKVISARVLPIEDGESGENVIFSSSERNGGAVYVRQLSSICAYTDRSMQQQIGKRQIDKLNDDEGGDSESDIDFDDDDERDWVDLEGSRHDISSEGKGRGNGYMMYLDGQSLMNNLWRNVQRVLPL